MTSSRKTILGGSKDMRSSDSSKKAFVQKVREISAVANWSISISEFWKRCWPPLRGGCWRGASFAEDRFLLSSRSCNKVYLKDFAWLNLKIYSGSSSLAKHILRRYVDIWRSSYPEYRICVWRATGQKPLKYLLPRVATTISFKERYRVTLCLC